MCNWPEPIIINYARRDVINPFSGRSYIQHCYIAWHPPEIRAARQCSHNLVLDMRDGFDLPVKIV
jgi:hypothetical protein